jgi:hypothetical protein
VPLGKSTSSSNTLNNPRGFFILQLIFEKQIKNQYTEEIKENEKEKVEKKKEE